MADRINDWMRTEGAWWASSFVFHMLLMCVMMLIGTAVKPPEGEAPSFEEANVDDERNAPKLERFEVAETPEEPTELSTDTLTLEAPGKAAVDEEINDNSAVFEHKGGGMPNPAAATSFGGLGGFEVRGVGPGSAIAGTRGGGVGVGVGTGANAGSGGGGTGFGGIGRGMRKAQVGRFGGTKQSERSVAGALNWIHRHQMPDGSWSFDGYKTRCTDASCTGTGNEKSGTAATAMALLPYFAAGQTHESRGPYQRTIYSGLFWMMKNQKSDGDLRGGGNLYAHGLAAICLCEAYGLSKDATVGKAAQAAIRFIENSQCAADGGWRYTPGQAGDTSVVGWQVMALKSGLMAGLSVNPKTLEGAKRFLKSMSSGSYGGKFGYDKPGAGQATTAVGLLCSQYMGAKESDPLMKEGVQYIMSSLPRASKGLPNLYYYYYATQVMHNVPGENWDNWNRKMRRVLIDSQEKEGCAADSWDPSTGGAHLCNDHGGRIYVTSLAALTLEVYYRYLPLYQLDKEKGEKGGGGGEGLQEAVKAGKGGGKDAKAPEPKKEVKTPAPEAKKDAKKDAKK